MTVQKPAMSVHMARQIVARQVVADTVSREDDLWGSYPDIGEGDWAAIVLLVDKFAPDQNLDDYVLAYELLEGRAET